MNPPGLDPEERNRFNNLLSEIGEEIIIILSTHLVEDVRNLCSQMAIMNSGTMLAQGDPADLIKQMEGRMWQKQIIKSELALYKEDLNVISSQFVAGKMSIRVFTSNGPVNFQPVAPTLEDV